MIKRAKPSQTQLIFSSPGFLSPDFAKEKQVFNGKSYKNGADRRWDETNAVKIEAGPVGLHGILNIPTYPTGLVVFIDGTTENGLPSNRRTASHMHAAGLATMLFNLLTREEEERDGLISHLRSDVGLVARRAIGTLDWLGRQPVVGELNIGFFGTGSGTAAALIAAIERPENTGAVVLRGGQPDFINSALPRVKVPVLLLIAEHDPQAGHFSPQAVPQMDGGIPKEICVVRGATNRFTEPGVPEIVTQAARDWFQAHLLKSP